MKKWRRIILYSLIFQVAPSVPELQSTKSPTKGSPTKKPITNGLAESDDDSDDEPVLRTKIYKKVGLKPN